MIPTDITIWITVLAFGFLVALSFVQTLMIVGWLYVFDAFSEWRSSRRKGK